MTGYCIVRGKKYIFRDCDTGFIAWDFYDETHRPVAHKWNKLPVGQYEIFNFDKVLIPETVSYNPSLG
jgi:hypothetical protein